MGKQKGNNTKYIILIVLCLLGGFLIYSNVNKENNKYEEAIRLLESNPEKAKDLFKELGDYKDSKEIYFSYQYDKAIESERNQRLSEAKEIYLELDGYKDTSSRLKRILFSHLEVKDTVLFGHYTQEKEAQPIEWIVLQKEGNRIMLISRYCLDVQKFHNAAIDVTWENSSLRKWLNETFLNKAFQSSESKLIATTLVENPENYRTGTNCGKDTKDKIYLLNVQEAKTLYLTDEERIAQATSYVIKQNATVDEAGNCYWWLRSSGNDNSVASLVGQSGGVSYGGTNVDSGKYTVRPVLWIELD